MAAILSMGDELKVYACWNGKFVRSGLFGLIHEPRDEDHPPLSCRKRGPYMQPKCGYQCLDYRQTSNIWRTKSKHLNVSRLVLQFSLPNPLKPGVKSSMKMNM